MINEYCLKELYLRIDALEGFALGSKSKFLLRLVCEIKKYVEHLQDKNFPIIIEDKIVNIQRYK